VVDRAEVGDIETRNVTEFHKSHRSEVSNELEETDSIVVGWKITILWEKMASLISPEIEDFIHYNIAFSFWIVLFFS